MESADLSALSLERDKNEVFIDLFMHNEYRWIFYYGIR